MQARGAGPVSYTHLDVYKRQVLFYAFHRARHGLIIQDLKGVGLEREQLPDGNLLNLFPLLFLSGFFGGEDVDVYKRQFRLFCIPFRSS